MAKRGRPRHPDVLTPREWEVLALLREGLTNEQIAERLGTTERTARYHVSEILSKLGVATRQEAAAWQAQERPGWRAVVPLLIWRRAGIVWAAPLATVTVLTGTALIVALFGWALIRTHAGNELLFSSSQTQHTSINTTLPGDKIEVIPSAGSVLLDLQTGDLRLFTTGRWGAVHWLGNERLLAWDNEQRRWVVLSRNGQRVVSDGPSNLLVQPAPDGSKLVGLNAGRLETFDIATGFTTAIRTLFGRITHGEWSPEGGRLAYVAVADGEARLALAKADGSEPRVVFRITGSDPFIVADKLWSPDGTMLKFEAGSSSVPPNSDWKGYIFSIPDGKLAEASPGEWLGTNKAVGITELAGPSGTVPHVYVADLSDGNSQDLGVAPWFAASPGGKWVGLSHPLDAGVKLVNVATGVEYTFQAEHNQGAYFFDWSSDGRKVIISP